MLRRKPQTRLLVNLDIIKIGKVNSIQQKREQQKNLKSGQLGQNVLTIHVTAQRSSLVDRTMGIVQSQTHGFAQVILMEKTIISLFMSKLKATRKNTARKR